MTKQKRRNKKAPATFLDRIRTTVRGYVLRGMLVLVPLGVTAYVLKWCYSLTAGRLLPWLRPLTGELPYYIVVLLSIVLFTGIMYTVGLIAGLVLGRRLIALGEWFLGRIPVVKTIYGASRQALDVISVQMEGQSYQAVALVPFPSPHIQSLAFVTGQLSIDGEDGYYRTFVPTTPNPTSGYFEIYRREQVQYTNLTVEDAAKAIMSAGILTPGQLHKVDCDFEKVLRAGPAAKTGGSRKPPLPKKKPSRGVAHTRNRLVSGLLILVPVAVTAFVITSVYDLTAGRIEPLARVLWGPLPPYVLSVFSIALLLALLYLAGYIATLVVGVRLIHLVESIIGRMPFVPTVYGATKQIIASLIDPASGPKFEAPVLVEFPCPGVRTIGFVVGRIQSEGRALYKIFIPTTPNVTVGLLQFFAPEAVSGCSLSLEEAIKMVVSGGIIGSGKISLRPVSETLAEQP